MGIGALQSTNYRMDYEGYEATGDKKTDEFYSGLSSAVEKSTTNGTGEVLGLTMLKYNDSTHYGMSATYSTASTEADPIVKISSNYGGEQRYYDVHVKNVDPKNASQLEMFALSCYLDEQGITDGGTYGSFTRMKAYASNASYVGNGIDLHDSDNASVKIDWVAMLQQMSQHYLQNSQTYSQYLDCNSLASKLKDWSDEVNENKTDNTDAAFQIGGQSYTQDKWEKLLEKIDKDIDTIKEEQKERFEKQQDEKKVTEEQIQELFAESRSLKQLKLNIDVT